MNNSIARGGRSAFYLNTVACLFHGGQDINTCGQNGSYNLKENPECKKAYEAEQGQSAH